MNHLHLPHHRVNSRLSGSGFNRFFQLAALAATLLVTGCATRHATPGTLFVYSTIDALLSGAYDGDLTVARMVTRGDIGLGTFNGLDGEMLLLGGVPYHFRADGSVTVAKPEDKSPLAYVMPFTSSMAFPVDTTATTLAAIETAMDAKLPNKNLFYALDITGDFTGITTRAIAAQVRPYKPLAELVKTQVLFKREAVTGTLVGIRSPGFSKGISVPGWHWHFVSADRSYGGHVLAIASVKGLVKVAPASQMAVELPENDDFAQSDQTKDRALELHQVEKARH